MIKTNKTEQEIINLIHANTKKSLFNPERTFLGDRFPLKNDIYNYSKNGVLYLFAASTRTGIVTVLYRIIIKNNNDHRLVIFKPKFTRVVWFIGIIAYLGFTSPIISTFKLTNDPFKFIAPFIILIVFALILTGLFWVVKTGVRQSLEKEIDTFIG